MVIFHWKQVTPCDYW